jgi:hypothetical protein
LKKKLKFLAANWDEDKKKWLYVIKNSSKYVINKIEELDGPAVRALSVRSRKLSNIRKGQSPDVVVALSISQHDDKHFVPTPLSGE